MIIRDGSAVIMMHLVATAQRNGSRAPDYWDGVLDALTWLCEADATPALDVHWENFRAAARRKGLLSPEQTGVDTT